MRRLAAIVLLVLAGVVVASASSLDVDGGTLQALHVDAKPPVPTDTCMEELPGETTIPPEREDAPEDPAESSVQDHDRATACEPR